jgi:hypothetical protein
LRGHNKRPNRVDVTKIDMSRHESGETGLGVPPAAKVARTGNQSQNQTHIDPNSSDHVVAMTQLKEQMASLQKQLAQKDAMLLSKDKQVFIFIAFYTILGVQKSLCRWNVLTYLR